MDEQTCDLETHNGYNRRDAHWQTPEGLAQIEREAAAPCPCRELAREQDDEDWRQRHTLHKYALWREDHAADVAAGEPCDLCAGETE